MIGYIHVNLFLYYLRVPRTGSSTMTFPSYCTCRIIPTILHTLQGFSVEGKIGSSDEKDSYVHKCVYVEGTGTTLKGFIMDGLTVRNCG